LIYFLAGACGSVLDVYREAFGEDLECVEIAEQKIVEAQQLLDSI
jgi:hypothetical protein